MINYKYIKSLIRYHRIHQRTVIYVSTSCLPSRDTVPLVPLYTELLPVLLVLSFSFFSSFRERKSACVRTSGERRPAPQAPKVRSFFIFSRTSFFQRPPLLPYHWFLPLGWPVPLSNKHALALCNMEITRHMWLFKYRGINYIKKSIVLAILQVLSSHILLVISILGTADYIIFPLLGKVLWDSTIPEYPILKTNSPSPDTTSILRLSTHFSALFNSHTS